MSFEEDVEEPASVMLTIRSGQNYDIKNMPGAVRKRLIESGEASIDSFVQADNMPGHKLQKLRDKLKSSLNGVNIPSSTPVLDITKLEEGSLVSYRKVVTEVKKLNVEKGLVFIDIKGNKKGWVSISKLKPVDIPLNEEE